MTTVRATAPAKLVLLGEYAVLEGAPAVVCAVDRRVEVVLTPGATPGAALVMNGRPAGIAEAPIVARTLERHLVGAPARADVHVATCSRALLAVDDTKLGLGSSAAVAVALDAALRAWTGDETALEEVLRAVLATHREAQGGRGSGVDVAASALGGVLAFRLADATGETSPEIHRLSWPDGLHLACVFAGCSARTSEFLERVGAWRDADAPAYRGLMADMSDVARAGRVAFDAGRTEDVLETVSRYHDLMAALGTHSGADIVSAPHARMSRIARDVGAVYKPSGAGGGDVGLVFSNSRDVLARVVSRVAEAGCSALDLAVGAPGVDVAVTP